MYNDLFLIFPYIFWDEHIFLDIEPEHLFCQFSPHGLISPWMGTVFRLRNSIWFCLEDWVEKEKHKSNLEFLRNTPFIKVFWENPLKGIYKPFPFLFQRRPPSHSFIPNLQISNILHLYLIITASFQEPPDWNGLVECGPVPSLARSESSPPLTQVTEPCDEVLLSF